jgi:hypothetical protein
MGHQGAADNALAWLINPTPTTELEDQQDSILPDNKTALATTTLLLGKPHNILVMGRACFLRVPVSEANDLNFLLCRCDETGYASRLGNNEIQLMKPISLNSVTKNRTLQYPNPPNPIKQRIAADVGMVLGFTWNKEEQCADADV